MNLLLHLFGFDPGSLQNIESLRLGFAWGWAEILLLTLLTLPICWYSYRLEDRPHSRWFWRLTTGLRLAFAFGIILLLAGPRFTVTGIVPQKNKLAVLIDSSRSMSIVEDGKSRLEKVRGLLTENRLLQRLEKQTELPPSLFSFSNQVSPLTMDEIASFSIAPDGLQTNLSRAVSEVSANLGDNNLLGMILLTDGAHNYGDSPQEALGHLKVPLYFLGTGKSEQAVDAIIHLERPPSLGFLNAMVRVRGEVRLNKIATSSVTITVRRDGKPFDQLTLSLASGESVLPFSLNIPCEMEGAFTYSFALPSYPRELTYDNNEAGFLLKVVKDRLKVLLLAGTPDWDFSFVKQALQTDNNAVFQAFTRINDQRWLRTENFLLKGSGPLPELASEVADVDVLILGGVAEPVIRPVAEAITQRLESGKLGMMIFPAPQGYVPLGYAGTPMERWFPVDLRGETWRGMACNLSLPGKEPPVAFLRLLEDPVQNQEFFLTMVPKFEGLFTYPRVKPGAQVLLASTLDQGNSKSPALLVHRVGQGQVGMLTGGALWPMGFRLVPTGKSNKPYIAMMLNLLKWLANRREDSQVVLEAAAARGFVHQPLQIRAWVYDSSRRPLDSAQVTGWAQGREGEQLPMAFLAAAEKGCYEATFLPPRRGKFELRAEARQSGQFLGEGKTQVLIEIPTAEFDHPEMNETLMQALASGPGGAFRPIDKAEELLKSIQAVPGSKRETRAFELRESGVLLLFLLLLPLAEWILRRRKGFS